MSKILYIISFLISYIAYADNCHPHIDEKKQQFIIGYGSLISEESKNKTYPNTGSNLPIEVNGFKRSFCVQNHFKPKEPKAVFLGVQRDTASKFNGVIFNIPPEHIKNFDQREIGYCRVLVNKDKIKMLIPEKIPLGQYWIYIPQKRFLFQKKHKPLILKYYKDIYLKGCLDIENKYHIKNYYQSCLKDLN